MITKKIAYLIFMIGNVGLHGAATIYNLTKDDVPVQVRSNVSGLLGLSLNIIIKAGDHKVIHPLGGQRITVLAGNENSQFWNADTQWAGNDYYILRKDGRFDRWKDDSYTCNNPPINNSGCRHCSGVARMDMNCKGQFVVTGSKPTIEGRKERLANGSYYEGAAYIFKGEQGPNGPAISPAYYNQSVGNLTVK